MKSLTDIVRRFRRCTSGTAMIEAAILMPVMVIFMVGVADFGRVYGTLATAQKSMRDATRYLTLLPPSAVCGWGLTNAKNLAVYGNVTGTGSPLITGWTTSNVTMEVPTSCTTNPGVIRLSTDVPFTAIMWSVLGFSNSITLNTKHEERWIGQ
jgi:Flp pilus assembly protein TadG